MGISARRGWDEFDRRLDVLGNAFGDWFRSLTGAWIGGLREPLGNMWFPVFQHLVIFALEWLYFTGSGSVGSSSRCEGKRVCGIDMDDRVQSLRSRIL